MRDIDETDLSALPADDRAALEEMYARAEELLADRAWNTAETEAFEEEFTNLMNETGLLSDGADSPFVTYKLMPVLEKIFKAMSDAFEFVFGGSDFWSAPINVPLNLIKKIFGIF